MINFSVLENKLTELFPGKKFNVVSTDITKRPTIQHDDLMDTIGSFSLGVKNVEVGFFSYRYSEDFGDLWGTICMFYELHSRGSNGMEIMSVWYNESADEWIFRMTKDNK